MAEQAYRTEWDSMGAVRVPLAAYYGAQTQRAVENFPVSGRRFPGEFIRALGAIKFAAAAAMMPAMCLALMEAIDFTANAVTVFAERCADGIAADRARCEEMVERGLAMATALVPIIGYDRAAKIAQKALATGKTIREVAEEVLAPQDLAGVLDPWTMIKPGIRGRT